MDRIVELTHSGQRFTFRVDQDPPLAFWRVESEGRIYRSPMRVFGDEQPEFSRALAEGALNEWA